VIARAAPAVLVLQCVQPPQESSHKRRCAHEGGNVARGKQRSDLSAGFTWAGEHRHLVQQRAATAMFDGELVLELNCAAAKVDHRGS
jgi:hypothetical protein